MFSLFFCYGWVTLLFWLIVDKVTLKNCCNGYDYQFLLCLVEILFVDVSVCIVVDRGFGDYKLYWVLSEELKFDFVISFRGNIAFIVIDVEACVVLDWFGVVVSE